MNITRLLFVKGLLSDVMKGSFKSSIFGRDDFLEAFKNKTVRIIACITIGGILLPELPTSSYQSFIQGVRFQGLRSYVLQLLGAQCSDH